MRCPLCADQTLMAAHRHGIEIDFCPQCKGVWLDRGELESLFDRVDELAAPATGRIPVPPMPPPQPATRPPTPADDRDRDDRDRDDRDRQHRSKKKTKKRKSRNERIVDLLDDLFDFD